VSDYERGSFVIHAKLGDLGSGEILGLDKGTIRIRFASGERHFVLKLVEPHLSSTLDAPHRALPASAAKRERKKKKAS
jgi:hypothetical protein